MDSIVKHLRENRISKSMQTITKNRANLLGALYEAREYYKTGNSNRFCLALLEKLEKNPNANINRLIASIPYDNHEGVLTESPFPELQYIKLDRDKRNGTEYIEVQIGNNIYRYIYKGDSDASHDTKWAYEKTMSIYKYSPGKAYAWLKPKCILYYNGRTNTHPYNNSLPKLKEDTFVTLNVMKNGKLTSGRLYSNKRLIIEDEVFSLDCQDIDFINRTTNYRSIPLDYDALVRNVSTVTGSGFMEESKKINESADVSWFELRNTSPLYKSAMKIVSDKNVKDAVSFQINDFEPSDVIFKYADKSYVLVDLDRDREMKFRDRREIMKYLDNHYGIYEFIGGRFFESKKLKESRSDLEKELRRVQSGSNHEFIRKYNLSLSDIRELQGIIFSKEKETINSNVVKVLNDYGIKTRVRGIGWVVESIQSDAEKKRKTRKDTGNLIYNMPSDVNTHHEETDVGREAMAEGIRTSGHSRVYKYKGLRFRYDYASARLQVLDTAGNGEISSVGLSRDDWEDDPQYWIETYYHNELANV